jgi:hypothetical protein
MQGGELFHLFLETVVTIRIRTLYWQYRAKFFLDRLAALSALLFISLISPSVLAMSHDCKAVIDAGSSSTRLYVFEKQGDKWTEYRGDTVSALADPVRSIRGKTWQDADRVVAEVTSLLGPTTKAQSLEASRLSWKKQCKLSSISVYATAGMRIAEQEHPDLAAQLWQKLKVSLKKNYPNLPIQARTLSGFEEGLFMWLALHQQGKGDGFGAIDVGGASAQVVFPCNTCAAARPVKLKNKTFHIFSYSFLGLGGDELLNTVGKNYLANSACAFAAGKNNPSWQAQDCEKSIPLNIKNGIADPYNFGPQGRGTFAVIPAQAKNISMWYFANSLAFYTADDIHKYCVAGESAFKPESACFRAVYNTKLLNLIGVKKHESASASTTFGAAICEDSDCLALAPRQECAWMKTGCLAN